MAVLRAWPAPSPLPLSAARMFSAVLRTAAQAACAAVLLEDPDSSPPPPSAAKGRWGAAPQRSYRLPRTHRALGSRIWAAPCQASCYVRHTPPDPLSPASRHPTTARWTKVRSAVGVGPPLSPHLGSRRACVAIIEMGGVPCGQRTARRAAPPRGRTNERSQIGPPTTDVRRSLSTPAADAPSCPGLTQALSKYKRGTTRATSI